jgi:hypothetical protein
MQDVQQLQPNAPQGVGTFNSGNASTSSNNRGNGFSVRCLEIKGRSLLPLHGGRDFLPDTNRGTDMARKLLLIGIFWIISLPGAGQSAWALLTIDAGTAMDLELAGYDGLSEMLLFKGSISPGEKQEIDIPYRGLALLRFPAGQVYPLIIGESSFGLHIAGPGGPPSFSGSDENEMFSRWFSGEAATVSPGSRYDFARLMIQAKQLLESSHSLRTLSELSAKKVEFHAFVRNHYQSLRHSDMVRRLIGQYFMMHEYADYSSGGSPAKSIKLRHQQEVVDGVGNWLEILKSHIPEHEIVNYCISLYYQRSMVTLASLIGGQYQDAAFCPGAENRTWNLPGDLLVVTADGMGARKLETIKGPTIFAFVSDDCPVSMVETVMTLRRSSANEDAAVIVVPLQQLSQKHLAMSRMVRSERMFFLNDEKWRQENLKEKPKLPLFFRKSDS